MICFLGKSYLCVSDDKTLHLCNERANDQKKLYKLA